MVRTCVQVCKGVMVNRVLHSAQEERSRLELHPHASITLDHARLSVSYSQGITWVLTTDLGLLDGSLAEHLDATAQARHTNALVFAIFSYLPRALDVQHFQLFVLNQ